MTRARENANISPAVGRNMIINGSMNVAARNSSVTGIGATTGYFTCDRWRLGCGNTAGRLTASQTADGPNGISANCLKLDCTTADTSIAASELLIIQHLLEGQNVQRIGKGVAGAKQITVSFYAKANAAFTFVCQLADIDNSRNISKLFNVTTDWVRQELTFPADVDDGSSPFDDNNATSLELNIWLHAGATYTGGTLATSWANAVNNQYAAGIDSFYSSTDNNFFITGVQMEVGPVATDFEQEDISTTIAKCQRYFYRMNGPLHAHPCWQFSTNAISTTFQSPVTMRTTPSFTRQGTLQTGSITNGTSYYSNTGWLGLSALSYDSGGSNPDTFRIDAVTDTNHSNSAGAGGIYIGTSPAALDFDAEL